MRCTLAWLIALVASSAACLRQTEFRCTTSAECGAQGTCEQSVGFCSFPDSSCGSRFGDSAGPYANQCVNGGIDAGVDGPRLDASHDAPTGCPAGYDALAGLPHLYKVITTADSWTTQAGTCTSSSSAAYLAIPDDLTELQALDTLFVAPTTYWVGIDDLATNGTFVTVKNAPAPTTLWAPGQPDNAPSSRCVDASSTTAQLSDDKCNTHYPSVCECEP